jgi:cytochrome c556
MLLRARIANVVAAAVTAGSLATITWSVHAQSTTNHPAEMPSMDHGMPSHGQRMPDHKSMTGTMPQGGQQQMGMDASEDTRQLVRLPPPMQAHMLANMRDHLATLNAVLGDVAEDKFDAASKLTEARLGMSSLKLHHAAEMAPYFPQPMQEAGTSMHHAASRLAIVLQDAAVAQSFDSMRKVDAALHEVTSECIACHAAYRVR